MTIGNTILMCLSYIFAAITIFLFIWMVISIIRENDKEKRTIKPCHEFKHEGLSWIEMNRIVRDFDKEQKRRRRK